MHTTHSSTSVTSLVSWLQARVRDANADGLVVGLSGGIDSAVVGALCKLAMPDRTIGLIMPCHSDPLDASHADLVAAHFNIKTSTVDLGPVYDAMLGSLTCVDWNDLAHANLKPRLRMTALYYIANVNNLLVAGTGNRSELTVGYFTKYGDGGVDVLPIGHLFKSGVRALALELGVPQIIIDKPPSAGLWPGQTDEREMGFTYDDIERYVTGGLVPPDVALRIAARTQQSEHKRLQIHVPTP
jgi:NAD+ synthase